MPVAVFPTPRLGRTLPYVDRVDVLAQGGALVVADVPVSVWPASAQRAGSSGEVFDHEGQAASAYAAFLVDRANLTLVMADGRRFRVVGATHHRLVPHVALELRRVLAGG